MTKPDPVIGIQIARSDVAFIHDVLMSCRFSGDQMLQASGIIAGLRPALATVEAPAAEAGAPDDQVPPAAKPKAKRKR